MDLQLNTVVKSLMKVNYKMKKLINAELKDENSALIEMINGATFYNVDGSACFYYDRVRSNFLCEDRHGKIFSNCSVIDDPSKLFKYVDMEWWEAIPESGVLGSCDDGKTFTIIKPGDLDGANQWDDVVLMPSADVYEFAKFADQMEAEEVCRNCTMMVSHRKYCRKHDRRVKQSDTCAAFEGERIR